MLAKEAGLVLRAAGDPEHVFLPQRGRQLIELRDRRACFGRIAALERGAALRQDRVGPLARGRHLRFAS